MLMSKSRLEKFLYALYSLDSSDLPTPLSRIEELYSCLVTGAEPPTFKPLSRVEKYLMAILGVYDVESLPNPLSRVEVLLYKLATGDDNLDDVEIFLSEHEELLADIIRNGGTGGNIDIEYVLYNLSTEFNTLYNTAEKPVKSVILKGNTLVNLVKTSIYGGIQSGTCVDGDTGYKVIESIVNTGATILTRVKTIYPLSPSTVYYLKLTDVAHTNSFLVREQDNGVNLTTEIHDLENKIIKFTTSELGTSDLLFYQRGLQVGAKVKYSDNLIISDNVDSLYNADDYFTGMQSVKMPVLTTVGKNLFDKNKSTSKYYIDSTGNYVTGGNGNVDFINQTHHINNNRSVSVSYSKRIGAAYVRLAEFDKNNNFIRRTMVGDKGNLSFNLNTNTYYIVASVDYNYNYFTDLQIEFSPVATSYEPFKSNILTVNEDVELRGIGEVKDELNLLTGEVVERIGEIVLDGSEDWEKLDNYSNDFRTFFVIPRKEIPRGAIIVCGDYLPTTMEKGANKCGYIFISLNNLNVVEEPNMSLDTFKNKLKSKPIKFQYQLATESIKTVDLSTVNQDGNGAELSTFNDITHVTLSSEGLIPEAKLEVATKNEEVLNTMSLEMDDISTTQNDLQETSNTQSENVDATMMATTEIYEQIL